MVAADAIKRNKTGTRRVQPLPTRGLHGQDPSVREQEDYIALKHLRCKSTVACTCLRYGVCVWRASRRLAHMRSTHVACSMHNELRAARRALPNMQ